MLKMRRQAAQLPVDDSLVAVAYCGHCGQPVTNWFRLGEIILVEEIGRRPYYAQILNILMEQNDPLAIVAINPQETAKVALAAIRKLGG